MFNSIQFVEGLKENELKLMKISREPSDSAFALCSTFESITWFVEGVRLGYFDSRNAREVIRFYYDPLLSRLRRARSDESEVLTELLRRKGLGLAESRFTAEYNLILGHLPAFEPLLTVVLNERDPFLALRIHDDLGSMLTFESVYAPASLFNSDSELQLFTKMLNFANEAEWDRYLKSCKPEETAACVIGVLEYTMSQRATVDNKSVATLNLDVFVRWAQAWRMGLRSQISADRFSKLAGLLDEAFPLKQATEDPGNVYTLGDFDTFSEAVQTIQRFWQLQMGAAA